MAANHRVRGLGTECLNPTFKPDHIAALALAGSFNVRPHKESSS